MKRALVLAGMASLVLAACSTSSGGGYTLKPEASNGHSLASLDLKPSTILESRQPAGNVSLQLTDRFADYGAGFVVAVTNLGGSPQAFGPQNVSASADGATLAVYTPEQLGERMTGLARSRIRATERSHPDEDNPDSRLGQERLLEAATEAAGRERRFNMFGGCPAGEGRCLIESADQGASYRADARNRELNLQSAQEVAMRLSRDMADLDVALAPGTIPPGEIGGGILVIQPPRAGQTVDITVTFAGQPHTFRFKAQPTAS